MKNKKTMIAIISVVALLLVLIGVTYAYWLVTKTQTNSNIISSACLDITLDNESNAINLGSQYPMSDADGMKLTPYTFMVTNNCNTSVDYQVALEAIGDESTSIVSSAIKVALDNNAKVYSAYSEVTPTISGAYESRPIGYARLAAASNEGSSATHSVRIWIDENAPINEANKTFQSKISVTVGQGIDIPYATGTLAYDILANNGGAGVSIIDAAEKADRIILSAELNIGTSENYYYGTEYTLDESTGIYVLSGDIVEATLTECRNGTKNCGKYTTKSTSTSRDVLYEITDWNSPMSWNQAFVTANKRKYITPFATPTTKNEAGLNKTTDDLGDTYYYRGDVTNNFVQFGSYAANSKINVMDPNLYESIEITFTEETPMYWRIIRINGDGTIRLVYDGTIKAENGTSHIANIGLSTYNGEDYLNGTYGDSDIKGVLDSWYNIHLKTNFGGYIADGIFCNDKEVSSYAYYDEEYNETTEENAYYTDVNYASYDRLANKKAPSLTCTRREDRYTTKTDLGNGLLNHPIGLITADEVVYAGGLIDPSNEKHYLTAGDVFWTSSPRARSESVDAAEVWFLSVNSLDFTIVSEMFSVRPVINLRSDVLFEGNGSFETPYVIKTN